MKRIVYTIVDSGEDGRGKPVVLHAFWDERDRDLHLDNNKNKNYYTPLEQIVDVEQGKQKAMNKLDGVDKLLLFTTVDETK